MTQHGKNLNWEVYATPISYTLVDGTTVVDDNHRAMVRSDNNICLGYTSSNYEIVQNKRLVELVSPMIDENILEMSNYGYLRNGKLVYVQCHLTEEITLGHDKFKPYISLVNSHEGSTKLKIGVGNTRIVCQNTFSMAYRELQTEYSHQLGINSELNVGVVMDYVQMEMQKYKQQIDKLQEIKCTENQLYSVIASVLGENTPEKVKHGIVHFYRSGKGNKGQTAYDAFNGVTEYYTHYSKPDRDRSQAYQLVGNGVNNTHKFLEKLLVLA